MATLDPEDWDAFRAVAHRTLDHAIDELRTVRDRPVWQKLPDGLRQDIAERPVPTAGRPLDAIFDDYRRLIAPYGTGNTHPGFMGWVHGGGTPVGMVAELLAAGLNANLGGRDHAPIELERTVVRWAAEAFGLPGDSGGLLLTGSSMANLVGVLAARRAALGPTVRSQGLVAAGGGGELIAYAGDTAHGCLPRAFDIAGLGTDALRLLPTGPDRRVRVDQLARAIAVDRAAGRRPFMVVGTAGTVDCGAVDDLAALAALARAERLWFHVDGAFGALGRLSPRFAPLFAGLEQADSIAFDFHKWAQVPYDAGCVLVRDRAHLTDAFAQTLAYLAWDARGLAANAPWPCDLGPELSRGFRALKVWMTLEAFGTDGLAGVVEDTAAVARHLADRIGREPTLVLAAPVTLNIVCFAFRDAGIDPDRRHADAVADLQEAGIAAPSTTVLDGRRVIRAAINNHRTTVADVDRMVDALIANAAARVQDQAT